MRILNSILFAVCLLITPAGIFAQNGCWQPGAIELSPAQIKAQLRYAAPISSNLPSQRVEIAKTVSSSVLTFAIVTDRNGSVTCASVVSGHPIFTGPALETIKAWKLRPPQVQGQPRPAFGLLVLSVSANESGFETKVLNAQQ